LRTALTHKSAHPSPEKSNERLEFLGDALLGAIVAEFVLGALPGVAEGVLSRARTRLVRGETLAEAARTLGVDRLLIVGETEERTRGRQRDSLLADAYEALVGALYLDAGMEAARQFVHETLAEPMASVVLSPPEPDPKTQLQIALQASGRGLPAYRVVDESGPDHAKRFVAEALAGTEVLGRGEGHSKRAAQIQAAVEAMKRLKAA
jgi:ribonuclease-3